MQLHLSKNKPNRQNVVEIERKFNNKN